MISVAILIVTNYGRGERRKEIEKYGKICMYLFWAAGPEVDRCSLIMDRCRMLESDGWTRYLSRSPLFQPPRTTTFKILQGSALETLIPSGSGHHYHPLSLIPNL